MSLRAHRAKPRLPYATPASPRLVPAPRLPARRLPARCLPCHHRLIASAPFPHAPGYSVARHSLPTLASRPRCLALRPRPTRSSTASARSTRRTTGTPSRYARAIATRMIVATAPRQLASASVQPVLKGLDIELIERLVKGLGVPSRAEYREAEAAASRRCPRSRSRRSRRSRRPSRRREAAAQTTAQAAQAAAAVAAATIAPSLALRSAPCSST